MGRICVVLFAPLQCTLYITHTKIVAHDYYSILILPHHSFE